MKNSHINVISKQDYGIFLEARRIIFDEFGDQLTLLDPAVIDRVGVYAGLSDNSRLRVIHTALVNRIYSEQNSALANRIASANHQAA